MILDLLYFFRPFCHFICWQLCWIRGLLISFTSSCFLFPVGGASNEKLKNLQDWGDYRCVCVFFGGGIFVWGISTPLHIRVYGNGTLAWNGLKHGCRIILLFIADTHKYSSVFLGPTDSGIYYNHFYLNRYVKSTRSSNAFVKSSCGLVFKAIKSDTIINVFLT